MKVTKAGAAFWVCCALLVVCPQASGQLDVAVDDVEVTEGTTSVQIPIYGTGTQDVTDMVLALQMGNGGTVTGNDPVPEFTAVDLTGTVWQNLAGYSTFSAFAPPDEIIDYNVQADTGASAVSGNGLLATVTVDLTGFSTAGNSWDIHLTDDFGTTTQILNGTTDVTGNLVDGSLTVVPEPVTIALLGVGSVGVLLRRRRF